MSTHTMKSFVHAGGTRSSPYAGDLHEPPIATVELDSRPQKGLWAEQLKKAQAEDGFREQVQQACSLFVRKGPLHECS